LGFETLVITILTSLGLDFFYMDW